MDGTTGLGGRVALEERVHEVVDARPDRRRHGSDALGAAGVGVDLADDPEPECGSLGREGHAVSQHPAEVPRPPPLRRHLERDPERIELEHVGRVRNEVEAGDERLGPWRKRGRRRGRGATRSATDPPSARSSPSVPTRRPVHRSNMRLPRGRAWLPRRFPAPRPSARFPSGSTTSSRSPPPGHVGVGWAVTLALAEPAQRDARHVYRACRPTRSCIRGPRTADVGDQRPERGPRVGCSGGATNREAILHHRIPRVGTARPARCHGVGSPTREEVPTDRSVAESLVAEIAFIHASFLEAVDDLNDERFRARPGTKAPAIAFHLWHTARWADMLQGRLGELAPDLERVTSRDQIWDARGLAEAWRLGTELGKGATGMGLDDDDSTALRLPAKAEVASYAREAFTAAEDALRSVGDAELFLPTADFYDEGDWVVLDHFGWHLTHAARHLGMIEALKGTLGLEGTVTV